MAARSGSRSGRAAQPQSEPPLEFATRRPRLVLAGLLLLYLVLAGLSFQPQPHTGGDNAGYITLAHSLLERHSYQDLYLPGEPAHTKYPPVFPLLLAGGLALGLKPWVGLKLIGILLGGAGIAATFLWLRRRELPGLALGVGLLLAVSPDLLGEVHWILSDVPFWCFTALALWSYERLAPADWRRFALALLFTILAYFTRSAGLPLVLAAFAWLAWRRHWRQLAAFALVLGPLALLWWYRSRTTGGVLYAGEFSMADPYRPELGRVGLAGLGARFADNLARYTTIHLPILLRGAPTLSAVLASFGVVLFALYGWGRRALRGAQVAELFLPLYIGLIMLWPAVWSGERFLLPVLGLLLAYAGDGVVHAFRVGTSLTPSRPGPATARARTPRTGEAGAGGTPARRAWGPLAGALAMLALFLLALPGLAANVSTGSQCTAAWRAGERYPCVGPEWSDFFTTAEWVGRELPPDAVVLSRKPRLFYVMSGRKSLNYPMASTTQALLATADSAGARWVVFDALGSLAQRYLGPAILQRPAAFCIARTAPAGAAVLFGILPGATEMPDAAAGAQAQEPGFAPCPRPLGAWAPSAPGR